MAGAVTGISRLYGHWSNGLSLGVTNTANSVLVALALLKNIRLRLFANRTRRKI